MMGPAFPLLFVDREDNVTSLVSFLVLCQGPLIRMSSHRAVSKLVQQLVLRLCVT